MREIKEIYEDWKEIDCQLRTIERDEDNDFIVEVGIYESLGEIGGDILTLIYHKEPTKEEIKEDVKKRLLEYLEDFSFCGEDYLTGREEQQFKVLVKIEKELIR